MSELREVKSSVGNSYFINKESVLEDVYECLTQDGVHKGFIGMRGVITGPLALTKKECKTSFCKYSL